MLNNPQLGTDQLSSPSRGCEETVLKGSRGKTIRLVDLRAQHELIADQVDTALRQVFDSGQFVGGQWVEQFESEFANFTGARHAIAVGSGTAALELALRASRITAGDEVIVPANTFFGTAESVSNVGAVPVFADVNPSTFHLDPASTESAISSRTRAIIPVHLYGRAMDLAAIDSIASRHNLTIIEDACQAHGAELHGRKVGASGRLTCFSFYPGKNLGCYGDGGAVTCNDDQHAELIRILRNHGSPEKYRHVVVGTNSRLDGIQAAVLSVKLKLLCEWNQKRRQNAAYLSAALAASEVVVPEAGQSDHVFHLFVIRTRKRDALLTHLKRRKIEAIIHYPTPLHLTEAYQCLGYRSGTFPASELLSGEILSLPMYPELTEEQMSYVAASVLELSNSRTAA